MAMTTAVVFALDGAGLINEVAVIAEGHLSGLVNEGLVVGEASPETATGGPLAWIENDDMIAIDVERCTPITSSTRRRWRKGRASRVCSALRTKGAGWMCISAPCGPRMKGRCLAGSRGTRKRRARRSGVDVRSQREHANFFEHIEREHGFVASHDGVGASRAGALENPFVGVILVSNTTLNP
jgi:hypothetical protein